MGPVRMNQPCDEMWVGRDHGVAKVSPRRLYGAAAATRCSRDSSSNLFAIVITAGAPSGQRLLM